MVAPRKPVTVKAGKHKPKAAKPPSNFAGSSLPKVPKKAAPARPTPRPYEVGPLTNRVTPITRAMQAGTSGETRRKLFGK